MKVFFAFSALALCAWSAIASAGAVATAKVTSVRVESTGLGTVFFDKAITGSPACVPAGSPSRMSFDAKTDGGRAILSIALSAKTSERAVSATGTNSCVQYPTTVESVSNLTLEN